MKLSASLLLNHPQWQSTLYIVEELQKRGHLAFLAGGCVRDALLNRQPADLDIATNATPEEVEKYFSKTIAVGKSFGVMIVVQSGVQIEVATFRTDGPYRDGRRPDKIEFSSPQEDAQRRDFTVNALFCDPLTFEIFDYVTGLKDLDLKQLKTVGEPQKRFAEDHLRLFRAIRFSAQLGFQIEAKTFASIQDLAALIGDVSQERLRDEWGKLLKNQKGFVGLELLQASGLLKVLQPEIATDYSQHRLDYKKVLEQDFSDEESSFAALFAPLSTRENWQVQKSQEQLEKMKLSRQQIKNIQKTLLWLKNIENFWQLRLGEQIEAFFDLSIVRAAQLEVLMHGPRFKVKIDELKTRARNHVEPFLSGDDLKSLYSGAELGVCLKEVYWAQLEGHISNQKEALSWAQNWKQKK